MIRINGNRLVDEQGRTLILRGVNLSGSSKVPYSPDGATWRSQHFFEHRDVSFVGRPFPLEEADEHFSRLREWGFTFLRFLITWEAIEHAGPGIYDQEYLDYVYQVVKKAGEYGIELFIDPHQDVWSRFSGGDGAPGWTFEAIGMDITKFKPTGAAIVHATHGDPLPRMSWVSNYGKLANLTMWTLFFGGDDFAPATRIDGVPAQEYLQSHYIEAIKQVAQKLKGLPSVAGFDTLNEPHNGLIGVRDLNDKTGLLHKGDAPTVFQAMLLGSGYPQEVGVWDVSLLGQRQVEKHRINEEGVSLWLDGFEPIWKQNGVWGLDANGQPKLLRPDHFSKVGDREVDFHHDYFRTFANRVAREIRSILPDTLIFVEGVPNQSHTIWTPEDAPDIVHAVHWYDDLTLLTKDFKPWLTYDTSTDKIVLGSQKVRQTFARRIAELMRDSEEMMNNAPTLIGEIGIPFDLKNKRAYRTGDFHVQVQALDATMQAIETNMVSATLWNYTPDNSNARGDLWNDEDLSLFSRDQQTGSGDINNGGRALQAAVRPYARKVAGLPQRMSFDIYKHVFVFEFEHDPQIGAPTEFFIPNYQYPDGYLVTTSDGEYEIDHANQTLVYRHDPSKSRHKLIVQPL